MSDVAAEMGLKLSCHQSWAAIHGQCNGPLLIGLCAPRGCWTCRVGRSKKESVWPGRLTWVEALYGLTSTRPTEKNEFFYYLKSSIMYDFNLLTPLDILTLPTNEHTNLDRTQKTNFIRELHVKVRANNEKRNEQYQGKKIKGVHRRKEGFPTQRKYKLQPIGDGTFQVLERINDNTYKLDLSTTYGEEFDSRTNPFEEGGNDRNPIDKDKDNLCESGGPMTRPKTKIMKQSLPDLSLGITESLEQSESEAAPKWVTLLQVDDDWSLS
ncbi:hypothetical protein CR513_10663, partial [Mucuna pruriens]